MFDVLPAVPVLDLNSRYGVNFPHVHSLRSDDADMLPVVHQPSADTNSGVLVDEIVEVGLVPLVQWTSTRRGLNDNRLRNRLIWRFRHIHVPVHFIGLK